MENVGEILALFRGVFWPPRRIGGAVTMTQQQREGDWQAEPREHPFVKDETVLPRSARGNARQASCLHGRHNLLPARVAALDQPPRGFVVQFLKWRRSDLHGYLGDANGVQFGGIGASVVSTMSATFRPPGQLPGRSNRRSRRRRCRAVFPVSAARME